MTGARFIVIGASAGGISALQKLLKTLDDGFPIPICVVLHIHKDTKMHYPMLFGAHFNGGLVEVMDQTAITANTVFFAPPDYHVLVENQETLTLTQDEPVLFSRPSIDVLFESAAVVFKDSLVAVILTGANTDGAQGMKTVKEYGGYTIVQTPSEAEMPTMPQAAITAAKTDLVAELKEIAETLNTMGRSY